MSPPSTWLHLFPHHTTANNMHSSPQMTVDMKCCAAYEVTTLARQKVVMKTNPAYEQVEVTASVVMTM